MFNLNSELPSGKGLTTPPPLLVAMPLKKTFFAASLSREFTVEPSGSDTWGKYVSESRSLEIKYGSGYFSFFFPSKYILSKN